MNKHINKLLNIICCISAISLGYVVKIQGYEILLKKKLNRFVLFNMIMFIILLCIWLSTQVVIFFWLLSLYFSIINVALLILGLNLFILLCMLVWLKARRYLQSTAPTISKDSNLSVLLDTVVKIVDIYKNSNKN